MDEEHLLHFDRKEDKRARKIAKKIDRSQYKKTDLEKKEARRFEKINEHLQNKNLLRGLVLSIRPEAIFVQYLEDIYTCTLKGNLKKEMRQISNLVAVGDFVFFDPKDLSIIAIDHRKSFLSKKSPVHKKKEQYIACNIDYVLITASCIKPPLNLSLIDHFIIATRKGNMTPIILINKIDLLEKETPEELLYKEVFGIYKNLGFKILGVSAYSGEGINLLKKIMAGHSSVLAGESGVGKSSLINVLTGSSLATKNVTEKTWRGTHTTTNASLIPLKSGGWCIDTPGIQKFGIWDLQKEDLEIYFPELSAQVCYYPNCSHIHEPQCGVLEAVREKKISHLRYNSYINLMKAIDENATSGF